jgi:hypothetical protein
VASFNADASNPMLKNILGVLLQPFLESFYIILHIISMVILDDLAHCNYYKNICFYLGILNHKRNATSVQKYS